MVAPEHVRSLAPDEDGLLKPLFRQGLEQLQKASKTQEYIDQTREPIAAEELERADGINTLQKPCAMLPVRMPMAHGAPNKYIHVASHMR